MYKVECLYVCKFVSHMRLCVCVCVCLLSVEACGWLEQSRSTEEGFRLRRRIYRLRGEVTLRRRSNAAAATSLITESHYNSPTSFRGLHMPELYNVHRCLRAQMYGLRCCAKYLKYKKVKSYVVCVASCFKVYSSASWPESGTLKNLIYL